MSKTSKFKWYQAEATKQQHLVEYNRILDIGLACSLAPENSSER
jgi:hypothetical protein